MVIFDYGQKTNEKEAMNTVPRPNEETRLSRRERKREDTRRKISEAAFSLFQERGYHQTTVEEIATSADVGKGTVFNYFPNKAGLLEEYAVQWTEQVAGVLGPPENWTGSVGEQIRRFVVLVAEIGSRDPELAKMAVLEGLERAGRASHEGGPPFGAKDAGFPWILRETLAKAQERGEVRSDAPPEYLVLLFDGPLLRALGRRFVGGGSQEEFGREVDLLTKLLLQGIKV